MRSLGSASGGRNHTTSPSATTSFVVRCIFAGGLDGRINFASHCEYSIFHARDFRARGGRARRRAIENHAADGRSGDQRSLSGIGPPRLRGATDRTWDFFRIERQDASRGIGNRSSDGPSGGNHSALQHLSPRGYAWLASTDTGKPFSFVTDVSAFLGHRTFHQQHHGDQRQRHHAQQQEDVEIGEG
jgi:hypothetical protein